MSTITRIVCPTCGTECIDPEANCYKCGSLLKPKPRKEVVEQPEQQLERSPFFRRKKKQPEKLAGPDEAPIIFDGLTAADLVLESAPAVPPSAPQPARTMTTLTGEVVEVQDADLAPSASSTAAMIGTAEIKAETSKPIFVLSFCRACGYQNPEGVVECIKCKTMLETVEEPPGDIEPLPRAWGFDVLGAAWIILGFGAIFSGMFLLKASDSGKTWADYFWTGIVACAPGFLIFGRFVFCKILFWVMTLASIGVWAVIGFIWYYVGLRISPNGEVGLIWLAMLSALSIVSYATVRLNDAFDFTL